MLIIQLPTKKKKVKRMSESARSVLKHLYKEGRMTEEQYQKIDRNLKDRPHGTWENCGGIFCARCSVCKDIAYETVGNFCPNCGADMRKKRDGMNVSQVFVDEWIGERESDGE